MNLPKAKAEFPVRYAEPAFDSSPNNGACIQALALPSTTCTSPALNPDTTYFASHRGNKASVGMPPSEAHPRQGSCPHPICGEIVEFVVAPWSELKKLHVPLWAGQDVPGPAPISKLMESGPMVQFSQI